MSSVPIHPGLDQLARPNAGRQAVRLTPDALRQVRGGHPWVYAESITSISPDGRSGDLAVVFDRQRRFAAIGLYDPDSPIRLKILHHGAPARIDDAWWRARLAEAQQRRHAFLDAPDSALLAYRVVDGENDGLPGLVVDRFAGVLVVKLYSAAWFAHLRAVVGQLVAVTGCSAVVLRLARNVARGDTQGLADGDVIAGSLDDGPVTFIEAGLRFEADVRAGQKTGWFLDQRANRVRVGSMAGGLDVLDVFCAAGGFSVHAAAGGARSVHSVDLSAPTVAAAARNMAENRDHELVARCEHTTQVGDAFEVMTELARSGRRFGLVIVDPPSFAQRQANVQGALRAYARLTALAVSLLVPGGILVQASCSSRVSPSEFYDTVVASAAAAGRPLVEIERTGHDIDHQVRFAQGEYLKAGFWSVP